MGNLYDASCEDLMAFARAFRDLSRHQQDTLGRLLDGKPEECYESTVTELVQALSGFNQEIDDCLEAYGDSDECPEYCGGTLTEQTVSTEGIEIRRLVCDTCGYCVP